MTFSKTLVAPCLFTLIFAGPVVAEPASLGFEGFSVSWDTSSTGALFGHSSFSSEIGSLPSFSKTTTATIGWNTELSATAVWRSSAYASKALSFAIGAAPGWGIELAGITIRGHYDILGGRDARAAGTIVLSTETDRQDAIYFPGTTAYEIHGGIFSPYSRDWDTSETIHASGSPIQGGSGNLIGVDTLFTHVQVRAAISFEAVASAVGEFSTMGLVPNYTEAEISASPVYLHVRAVQMSPVPESSSLHMFALGLLGISFATRRRYHIKH